MYDAQISDGPHKFDVFEFTTKCAVLVQQRLANRLAGRHTNPSRYAERHFVAVLVIKIHLQ